MKESISTFQNFLCPSDQMAIKVHLENNCVFNAFPRLSHCFLILSWCWFVLQFSSNSFLKSKKTQALVKFWVFLTHMKTLENYTPIGIWTNCSFAFLMFLEVLVSYSFLRCSRVVEGSERSSRLIGNKPII